MAESVARRDRVEAQASTGWYLWEAPGNPACVYLSLDFIERLEREVVDNFRSLTSRGSEIGGILLGGIADGSPAGVSVEDYEPVQCDYTRGPLYRLSDADLGRFERAVQERSAGGKLQVVGFFRSHTRKGLVLDAEDLTFLEARFQTSLSIALLIRPFATKASVAGLFVRDRSGFNTEPSALEFPFRSSQLTPSKRGPDQPAPDPAPQPARAQVVPIGIRRDLAPPSPANELPASPPQPAKPAPVPEPKPPLVGTADLKPSLGVEQAKRSGAPQASAIPPVKPAPVAPKPAAEQTKTPSAPPAAPPAAMNPSAELAAPAGVSEKAPATIPPASPKPSAPAEMPNPDILTKPAVAPVENEPADIAGFEEPKPASKIPMLAGLLAAAVLGFLLLFVYPGFLHHSSKSAGGSSQDSSPLTLRVEHTGTDLLLTWNRDSSAIRNASRASLAITDGSRHENYDMDLAQLRTGSIVYSPLGGDVSFQMEVIGKNQRRTATETLRLLQTRPSPMPAAQGQDTKKDSPALPNPPISSGEGSTSAPGGTDEQPADEPKPAPAPVKAFDAASLSQRLRPAKPAELADLPTPAEDGPVAPHITTDGSVPFASMPVAPAAPPVTTPTPRRSGSTGTAHSAPSGGLIQPAQLISRKEPEYPQLARQMGAKGTVELIATIGTDGAVKSVKAVKGHPLLVKAAEDAVMHWRYRPTLLNGEPVQNETRITLNFTTQ